MIEMYTSIIIKSCEYAKKYELLRILDSESIVRRLLVQNTYSTNEHTVT